MKFELAGHLMIEIGRTALSVVFRFGRRVPTGVCVLCWKLSDLGSCYILANSNSTITVVYGKRC